MLKKVLLAIPIVLVLLLVGGILAFNTGLFQSTIERKVADASGAKVQLGKVTLGLTWPLRVYVAASRIDHELALVEWERLVVDLATFAPPFDVRVTLVKPKITQKPAPARAQAPATPPGKAGAPSGPPNLRLSLRIEQGEVKAEAVTLNALDLTFAQKLLLQAPAALHLKTQVVHATIPAPLQLTVDTDTLTLTQETIKAQALKVTIAGLIADLQGTSLLKEGRHRWKLQLQAPDLSRLPAPPAIVPAKNWRGSIQGNVEINKPGPQAGWQAEGGLTATGVRADLALNQAGAQVTGPFALDLKALFLYHENLNVPVANGQVDLTTARVQYQDLFLKAAGVPLKLGFDAIGDQQRLIFKAFELQLAQIRAALTGQARLQAPFTSDLKIDVPTVKLTGLEKILIPLQKSPVGGELQMHAAVTGPLGDPRECDVKVNSLRLNGFTAQVDYQKPGALAARGPVVANVNAQGEYVNGEVKSARATGTANLRATALVLGPLRKAENQDFTVDFSVSSAAPNLVIDKLDLRTFFGQFGLKGPVGDPTKPKLGVTVTASPLNLSELRLAMPEFRDKIPKGELRANVQVTGPLEMEKPWNDWPLNLNGDISVSLPEYRVASAPAGAAPGKPAPAGPKGESEPLLPPGYLLSRAKLKIAADIAQVLKDKLVVQKISARGQLADGRYRGDVTVGSLFDGSVQLANLDVPLLDKRPMVVGQVAWKGLTIQDALGFAKPEYKEFASGKTQGHAEFTTLMPSEDGFLRALKARGEFGAEPVTLNSVKVGDMLNEAIKKVPLLKLGAVKLDPLRGEMKGQFEVAQETMQIPSFMARDVDGSELQMKGKVILSSMQADLVGSFLWVQDKIRGCIGEGNSDDMGRLIVPLAIKGDLMKPGFSILTDVVGKLAGRALECEKNKLIDKVKKDGAEGLKKELNKALKGILGG